MADGKPGRPPGENTAAGRTRFRFDVPDAVAKKIRAKAGDREMMRFLAETVCNALKVKLPPPGKRGPKPKA